MFMPTALRAAAWLQFLPPVMFFSRLGGFYREQGTGVLALPEASFRPETGEPLCALYWLQDFHSG